MPRSLDEAYSQPRDSHTGLARPFYCGIVGASWWSNTPTARRDAPGKNNKDEINVSETPECFSRCRLPPVTRRGRCCADVFAPSHTNLTCAALTRHDVIRRVGSHAPLVQPTVQRSSIFTCFTTDGKWPNCNQLHKLSESCRINQCLLLTGWKFRFWN